MGTMRKDKPPGTERARRVLSERNENGSNAQRVAETECGSPNDLKATKRLKTQRGGPKRTAAKRAAKVASCSEQVDENSPEPGTKEENPGQTRPKRAQLPLKSKAEGNAEREEKTTDHICETPRSSIVSQAVSKARVVEEKKVLRDRSTKSARGGIKSNQLGTPVEKDVRSAAKHDEAEDSVEHVFKVPRSSPRQLAKPAGKIEAGIESKKNVVIKRTLKTLQCGGETGVNLKKTAARTLKKRASQLEKKSPGPSGGPKKVTTKKTAKNGKVPLEQSDDNESKHPVYNKAGMTPLKRVPVTTSVEEKLHEYDFEFDEKEEEPVPKKKRKPIMKIQRVRTYARKKKPTAKDTSAIPPLIQQMLLSTPLKAESEKKRTVDKKNVHSHRILSVEGSGEPACSPTKELKRTEDKRAENQQDPPELPPSPCPSYDDNDGPPSRPSSPIASSGHVNAQNSFHTVALPTLHFGPISDSSTPNYVTVSTPRYSCNSTRKSTTLLNLSMNTPIKYHCEASDFSCFDADEPREYNLDNCFGFDEWDVDDPSQIRSDCPPPPPRPKPANLPKPPTMPAAEVIKLLEDSQVRCEEDSSMYDTEGETLAETTSNEFPSLCPDDGHSFVSESTAIPSSSEMTVDEPEKESTAPHCISQMNARKIRKSYERNMRPRRLQKNKSFDDEDQEDHSSEEDDAREGESAEPKRKANKRAKKREHGMNKKEEEEFEKWAAMFNAQCREIEKYELCVE